MPVIPEVGNVHSPLNLHGLATWLRAHATPAEVQEVKGCIYFEIHEGSLGALPPRFPLKDGGSVSFAEQACRRSECNRCALRRGGRAMRWIDQRWTCRAAYTAGTKAPAEMVADAQSREWPDGVQQQDVKSPRGGASPAGPDGQEC